MPTDEIIATVTTTEQKIDFGGEIQEIIIANDGANTIIASFGRIASAGRAGIAAGETFSYTNPIDATFISLVAGAGSNSVRIWVHYA